MGRFPSLLPLCACLVTACAFDPGGVGGEPAPDAPVVGTVVPDAAPPDADPTPPAGYQAVPGRDERLRPVLEVALLADAARDCADDADGAQLVVVDDAAANVALRRFADAQVAGRRIWLGITDAAREGQWRTLDGEPLAFTAWARDEPNDGAEGEDCAVMLGLDDAAADRGRWNDISCGEPRPYVCAWRAPTR